MENQVQQFEKAWERFVTSFKGKLNEKSKRQVITLSTANLILKEVSSDWFSGYGAEGKWLRDYKTESPERAKAITAILKHGLRLRDEVEQNTQNHGDSAKTKLVPAPVGITAALSALIAALRAALESFLKGAARPSASKNNLEVIENYIAQLQIHKKIILEVIQKPN